MLCNSVLEEECQKVLLHSINGHLRSSLFYDYLLVSDVLDINDLLDTRSLGMYSACMAPHFPALLCSVYRHCSFPRCYTSHCVCPSLNCVFPTALCCAQITSVVSNNYVGRVCYICSYVVAYARIHVHIHLQTRKLPLRGLRLGLSSSS